MAQCKDCGRKVGFFSSQMTETKNGPFCKECYSSRQWVRYLYSRNYDKAQRDPKAAATVALCHLVCAERVSVVYEQLMVMGLSKGPREPSWIESRAKAIEYARKAESLLPETSQGKQFVSAIAARAEKLNAPPAKQIQCESTGVGGPGVTYTYSSSLVAIMSGEVMQADFNETLNGIPGHEWMEQS